MSAPTSSIVCGRRRTQAKLDLVLYFVFFFPGVVALIWAGTTHAEQTAGATAR